MHNKSNINSNDQSLISIERKAIDCTGQLGSLYDGRSDHIIGKSDVSEKGDIFQSENPVRCEIIQGNTNKSQNLLQMVGIQDDLRLNILLDLVSRRRIAAIINHPYPLDEFTRLICYSYENRTEQFPEDVTELQKLIGPLHPKTTATHIIASISFGIDAIVVLKLPSDIIVVKQIDEALGRVRDILNGNTDNLSLTPHDENLFRQNTNILVYSNISFMNGMTSIRDICQFINDRSGNEKLFRPLTYTLEPIQLFYPQFKGSGSPFIQLQSASNDKLEWYLLQCIDMFKSLKYSLDYKVTRLLCGYLEERLCELQQQWVNLKNIQEKQIKQFRELVSKIRRGRCDISMIDKALSEEEQITFNENINRIMRDLNDLEKKGQFITDLKQEQFQYCNVVECDIDRKDNESTIEHKLIPNDQYDRVLCSNDTLNKNQPKQLRKLLDELIKKRKKHAELRLIYADFSYSSFELTKMIILSSSTQNKKETSFSTEIPRTSSNSEMINILLLGETGVGKSTFINALANYFTFDTLQQAETGRSVVLIPVSFLITVGNNFDEHIVKFGDVDALKHENFDCPGQSVTQRCKSYVFNLNHTYGQKLRIIDTTGFGDTRGVDQDNRNMEHILEYIKNLSHLNAICFLLKPNESQLNAFFQSCLTQLFSLLGRNIGGNIIFCFTNSRSTFYTPGDTAPLLKKMLASLPMDTVRFIKDNTFCFDSESFRYLVALQNKIEFSGLERNEYERSWSTSVIQSDHLIDYIRTQRNVYRIDGNLHSIKHAQLEIIHMIRPMLEAMRNILRNRVIHTMNRSNGSLELHPKATARSATICFLCTPYPLQVGTFWVAHNIPHEIRNNCNSCQCSLDQHHPIDYTLDYELSNKSSKYDHNKMSDSLHQLCQTSVDFAYFLMHINGTAKNDPFFIGLVQMITEEKYLSDNQQPNDFNLRLVDDLRELQKEYDKKMNSVVHNQEQKKLSDIYKLIDSILKFPMVRDQMTVVKEAQKMMMKQNEYEIPVTMRRTSGQMITEL